VSASSEPGAGVPASLKPALARGSAWTLAGYAAHQILRLGSNLILWRLLEPRAFGIMAIIIVFIQGIWMFSDMGIGPSIVQNRRGDDPDYLNTAWTLQSVRGLALYVGVLIAAIPLSHFYRQPDLAYLLPISGLALVLSSFNSTAFFTLKRSMHLGRLTVIEFVANVGGTLATVTWCILHPTVWALAGGGLFTHLLKLVLGHTLLPGIRNRFRWDRSAASDLAHFGRWVLLSSLLSFAAAQSDRLIFGKLIPIDALGVYSVATTWSTIPIDLMWTMFSSVLLPILSRAHNAGVRFREAFHEARTPLLIGGGWMVTCLVAGGPTLVRFLYDERALQAGWIIQVLAAGAWLGALAFSNDAAFLAKGRPKLGSIGHTGKLAGMIVLIPLGMHFYGFPGAVVGLAGSELLRYSFSFLGRVLLGLPAAREDFLLSLAIAVVAAAGFETARTMNALLASFAVNHMRVASLFEGVVTFVVVSGLWGALYLLYRRRIRGKTALASA
jgi:O-antigen/teichoic acid export membrane protein